MLTKRDYENKLAGLGCVQIGSGLYSNVFSVPNRTDIAVKVAELDPWPSYIQWATQNGYAGKLAPKVHSLKFYDGYYVAIMERLVCTMRQLRYGDDGEPLGVNPVQLSDYTAVANIWQEKPDTEATDLLAYCQLLRKHSFSGDMHDGNVMVRHDGQLVVTDPVSGSYSAERFRIKNGSCP